jgi:APA family basic amino acid/polyamine antiporter
MATDHGIGLARVALPALGGASNDLPDCVIFALLLVYVLMIAGLLVLRRTQLNLERPYKAIGNRFCRTYIAWRQDQLEILLLQYRPNFTWQGLIEVLLGLPVYFTWRGRGTV